MKSITHDRKMLTIVLAASFLVWTGVDSPAPKETQHSFDAPNKLKVSIKMIAPYAQQTDLQIVCVFKHDAAGDKYVAAMKDFNDKLGGLLSSLRDRGEFVGELGETMLFNVPSGTITPRRILVIGLGAEKNLSLDTLRVVGRVALREAVRLKVAEVSFAPTIRDQGNTAIDVGDGDRAVVEEVLLAYDTEKRLQAQGLADPFDLREWLIEAGPAYVDSAIEKTKLGIDEAARRIKERDSSPFRNKKS
jgi:hypothetical protein